MRTDLYTKVILTVIAVCLVWLCFNGVMPEAFAQSARPQPAPVILVDERGIPLPMAQGLRVNVGPQPIQVAVSNASVPVTVGNAILPMQLRSIQRSTEWDAVRVQVLRDPPTPMPTP